MVYLRGKKLASHCPVVASCHPLTDHCSKTPPESIIQRITGIASTISWTSRIQRITGIASTISWTSRFRIRSGPFSAATLQQRRKFSRLTSWLRFAAELLPHQKPLSARPGGNHVLETACFAGREVWLVELAILTHTLRKSFDETCKMQAMLETNSD